jgi:hypothetical protein
MDEVSAQVALAGDGVDSRFAVSVPMSEVMAALQEEAEADLVLDVVRENGGREVRRVTMAWDREGLERLASQGGEQAVITIDPESLQAAFGEDVEAHGMREIGATLAIVVGTVGAAAGPAAAEGLQPALSSDHAVQATVVAGMPRAMPSDYAQARAGEPGMPRAMPADYAAASQPEAGMPRAMPADYAAAEQQTPRAMPSDYAAADDSSVTLRRDPGAMPTGTGVSQAEPRGIENIRAAQPPPAQAPDPMAGIEAVRVGGSAIPDATSAIENVRAERAPAAVPDGGTTISAPSTGAAVAIGGAMLIIAAAAFALRRKGEPRPA